jgi:hypothetical protein
LKVWIVLAGFRKQSDEVDLATDCEVTDATIVTSVTLVTVTVRSEASNVFASSNTGIVGSNPTRSMLICVYTMFMLSCVGRGLAMG